MRPLLLKEAQVHPGMIVVLVLADKMEPEVDDRGPLLLQALMGGVPTRKKMYALNNCPGLFQLSAGGWEPQTLTSAPLHLNIGKGMEGFKEEVRFMPIYTFAPTAAPRNMEFVVYFDAKLLRYPNGRNNVIVRTDSNGKILSHNGFEYDFWEREFPLPGESMLVPTRRVAVEITHEPGIVYQGPESEWATVTVALSSLARTTGVRLTDVHHNEPLRSRTYLHFALDGPTQEDCRRFIDQVVSSPDLHVFLDSCPRCRTKSKREHRL